MCPISIFKPLACWAALDKVYDLPVQILYEEVLCQGSLEAQDVNMAKCQVIPSNCSVHKHSRETIFGTPLCTMQTRSMPKKSLFANALLLQGQEDWVLLLLLPDWLKV